MINNQSLFNLLTLLLLLSCVFSMESEFENVKSCEIEFMEKMQDIESDFKIGDSEVYNIPLNPVQAILKYSESEGNSVNETVWKDIRSFSYIRKIGGNESETYFDVPDWSPYCVNKNPNGVTSYFAKLSIVTKAIEKSFPFNDNKKTTSIRFVFVLKDIVNSFIILYKKGVVFKEIENFVVRMSDKKRIVIIPPRDIVLHEKFIANHETEITTNKILILVKFLHSTTDRLKDFIDPASFDCLMKRFDEMLEKQYNNLIEGLKNVLNQIEEMHYGNTCWKETGTKLNRLIV